MRALVIGHKNPVSSASEDVSWFTPFGVPKNHGRKRFSRFGQKSKLARRPRLSRTGWPQIRPPRPPSEAKNYTNRIFTQLEGSSLLHTSRPPHEAVWNRDLKFDPCGRLRPRPEIKSNQPCTAPSTTNSRLQASFSYVPPQLPLILDFKPTFNFSHIPPQLPQIIDFKLNLSHVPPQV